MTDAGTGRRAPAWQTAVPVALAAGAVAAQIAYPLTEGPARDRVTVAVVLLLAAASLTHAAARRGFGWAAALFVVSAGGVSPPR